MNAGLFALVVLLFLGAEAFKVRESKCMEEMLKVRAIEKLVQGGKQPGVG